MSGFWAVPLVTGLLGLRALLLNSSTASISTNSFNSSYCKSSTFCISCDVLNPSKKFTKGILALRAAKWATADKSITSWTDPSANIANPVCLAAITSWWSPKMFNAEVANALADTWNTDGNNSPAILYMFGIINNKPCEAV